MWVLSGCHWPHPSQAWVSLGHARSHRGVGVNPGGDIWRGRKARDIPPASALSEGTAVSVADNSDHFDRNGFTWEITVGKTIIVCLYV